MKLDKTLFTVAGIDFTGKSLILLAGGLFLIHKATKEIYHKAELSDDANAPDANAAATFNSLLGQVLILDLVFSIDSIITAVGMVDTL